jgi:protein-L-isoaspartate(D-aspartate) O-methyltransferase
MVARPATPEAASPRAGSTSWAIWITGLPGSGKSVIARAVSAELRSRGIDVVVLELDQVRKTLTPTPTYSDAEREAVYRALVYVGATLVDAGSPVIFDATAHRRAWRDLARAALPTFAEIQLLCSLDVCRQREAGRAPGAAPPGIYSRATQPGARVPGVNVDYELARSPELSIDTTLNSVEDAAATIVAFLQQRFLAAPSRPLSAPARDRLELLEMGSAEQRVISQRARDLAASLSRYATLRAPRRSTTDADEARERMVERQIAGRGVRDAAVLAAMRKVPRELFVSPDLKAFAYEDEPLAIGEGQTISQPYIVAAMIEAVRPRAGDRALEVGTGSGYSAAVLASIAADVYTIERLPRLADSARRRLHDLGYANVHVRTANGTLGWPEHAPYDVIIVTASGPTVPSSLLDQLAIGGRLVMPVGDSAFAQRLIRVTRTGADDYERDDLEGVAFVPLIGKEAWPPGERRG